MMPKPQLFTLFLNYLCSPKSLFVGKFLAIIHTREETGPSTRAEYNAVQLKKTCSILQTV